MGLKLWRVRRDQPKKRVGGGSNEITCKEAYRHGTPGKRAPAGDELTGKGGQRVSKSKAKRHSTGSTDGVTASEKLEMIKKSEKGFPFNQAFKEIKE